MRFIARSYLGKGDSRQAEMWALKSCAEAPGEREPWLDLARIYYATHQWEGLYYATKRMLTITDRPKSYICETDAWGGFPYDYASIAAYNLGILGEAEELCKKAIEIEPGDQRLKNNLLLIQEKKNVLIQVESL
jgi:hypothetical protein